MSFVLVNNTRKFQDRLVKLSKLKLLDPLQMLHISKLWMYFKIQEGRGDHAFRSLELGLAYN
jgi:hypothetical protein